jgi:hypothetical protein
VPILPPTFGKRLGNNAVGERVTLSTDSTVQRKIRILTRAAAGAAMSEYSPP